MIQAKSLKLTQTRKNKQDLFERVDFTMKILNSERISDIMNNNKTRIENTNRRNCKKLYKHRKFI